MGLRKVPPLHLWHPIRASNRPQATRGDLRPKVQAVRTHWKMGTKDATIQVQGQVPTRPKEHC